MSLLNWLFRNVRTVASTWVLQLHWINWDCLDISFLAPDSQSNIILLIVLYAENTMHCPFDTLDWPTCPRIEWIWLDLFTHRCWFHRSSVDKNGGGADKKIYLLVFTCLSVRAIHIEMLQDMSVKSFVLALIRFANLFIIPEWIYCNNARSFVAGCNIVKKYRTSVEFQDIFGTFEIKHLTIPYMLHGWEVSGMEWLRQ